MILTPSKLHLNPSGPAARHHARIKKSREGALSVLGSAFSGAADTASGPGSPASVACLHLLQSVAARQLSPEEAGKQIASLLAAQEYPQLIASPCQSKVPAYLPKIIQGRDVEYNSRARTLSLRSEISRKKPEKQPGTVAIISGSTTDLCVAEECRMVAEHVGCYVFQLKDMKVSAMDKVLSNLEAIRAADVLVVVSGLDGALPAVLAGLVEAPVIAVPTSAGDGATLHGVAPMLAAMCSSTPVTVVNIDDGRTAALTAMRILRQASRLYEVRRAAEAQAAALHSSNTHASPNTNASSAAGVAISGELQQEEQVASGPRCAWPATRTTAPAAPVIVTAASLEVAHAGLLDIHGDPVGARCAWPAPRKAAIEMA